MLSSFSIAFFGSTFVCDLIFWSTGDVARIATSMWLLGAGIRLALLLSARVDVKQSESYPWSDFQINTLMGIPWEFSILPLT